MGIEDSDRHVPRGGATVACDERRLLEHEVDLNANHLKEHLKQKESGNPKFDLADLRLMAQDLIDSIEDLRMHDDQHKCNGRIWGASGCAYSREHLQTEMTTHDDPTCDR